ncbi:MAG: secondary thiamine-phosphate synthase enzyme YjbQ [Nitrospinota bacterium]
MYNFKIATNGFSDIVNISDEIDSIIAKAAIETGSALIFVAGSTASITTIEYEPGAIQDLKDAIERIAPESAYYQHNERWQDGNGFSHVRAALLGSSFVAPFENRKLLTGTWQQIILIDFDNRPRERTIIVQLQGVNQ